MYRGYVKLWRNTLEDSGLYKNPHALALYVYLLTNATRTERKSVINGKVFDMNPGDLAVSATEISERLGLTAREVRTAVSTLEKLCIISKKTTNKTTVFSIVNWDTYQQERQAERQAGDKQPTSKRQAGDKQATSLLINKNEERRMENDLNTLLVKPAVLTDVESSSSPSPVSSPASASAPAAKATRKAFEYPADFSEFWNAYPRKIAKDAAWKRWQTLKREGKLPPMTVLHKAIDEAKASDEWKREGGQFIPHPATWLNQGRWMDERSEPLSKEPAFVLPDWAKAKPVNTYQTVRVRADV